MGAPEKNFKRSEDTKPADYRKLLWGVRQNREKQITLAKMTIRIIEDAIRLAEEEQEARAGQGKKPLVSKTKEIKRLRSERDTLEAHITQLSECGEQWPAASLETGPGQDVPAAEKEGRPLVLVIDDERITSRSLEHFLGQKGLTVVCCRKAQEGLNKALSIAPDLILLDILMPGMNGYQVLAELKRNRETERIPVIILSSLSREADILEGLEKGADDFIVKPYSPQILLSKVAKHLTLS
jgi:CheY-like chemotaxis protein